MSLKDLPEPECDHDPVQRVTSGNLKSGPHASIYVCGLPECIDEARVWAYSRTLIEAVVVPLRGAGIR